MIKATLLIAVFGMAAAAPQYAYSPYTVGAPAYAAYAAPAYKAFAAPAVVKSVAPEPYDAHPQYSFGYSVSDALTGDQKSHSETRDGDVVQGQYSLVEPDGALRVVSYTSDPFHGFNAVVNRQAAVVKAIAPAPVVRAYAAAPAYATYAAAPAVKTFAAAPAYATYAAAPAVKTFAAAPAYASYAAAPAYASYAAPAIKTLASPAYTGLATPGYY